MTPGELIEAFEVLAEAPGGVTRLRELVLQLAVRGKLVAQDAGDEPARKLVSTFATRKAELVRDGKIAVPRHPEGELIAEPPYEVPSSWVWMRLGDVGAIVGGGTPKSKDPTCWADKGVPWLTPADMRRQKSRYISRGNRDVSEVGLQSSSARLMPAGTVLFSSRAPIGHVGIAAQPLATNQGFKSCVPYSSDMSEYIYVYLRTVGPQIDAMATGTTFKEVSGKEVALVPIPVPPLAEQHRIAARVDELMALLDRLEAAQGQGETTRKALRDAALSALRDADDSEAVQSAWARVAGQMDVLFTDPADIPALRQTILQLAVRGRLVPQDLGDEPASRLLERIAAERERLVGEKKVRRPKPLPLVEPDEVPFPVPEGWEWKRLGAVATGMVYGSSRKSTRTGMVPVLRMGNLQHGEIDWTDLKYSSDSAEIEKYSLPPNTVLFNRTNSPELVGKTSIFRGERPAIYAGYLIQVRLSGDFSPEYLNYLLASHHARRWCWDVKSDGISQSNISASKLAAFLVPTPPLAEQHRIVAKVDKLMALCDDLESRLEAARGTRSSFAASAVGGIA